MQKSEGSDLACLQPEERIDGMREFGGFWHKAQILMLYIRVPVKHLYRLALAYRGKGDRDQTQELSDRAANFNALNSLNQAFIRQKTQKLSGK